MWCLNFVDFPHVLDFFIRYCFGFRILKFEFLPVNICFTIYMHKCIPPIYEPKRLDKNIVCLH